MIQDFGLSIDISETYVFSKENLDKISNNRWVKNQYPLVYFIRHDDSYEAYIGESTNFSNRVKNHLANKDRAYLNQLSIIGSDKFNKSATLEIESKLIQYLSAEGTYKLQNGNFGMVTHNYYQQDLYSDLFKEIWSQLEEKQFVSKSLEEIENTELFKYSPFKSLSKDQYQSVIEMLQIINENDTSRIIVNGSAGTGKTILASYLIKLLTSQVENIDPKELNENELNELLLIKQFQERYPNPEIGLVVAMTSLRKTLKNVFKNVPGLKSSMIISPSETFKKDYDLLLIDEAHRLRQYKNIGWRGAFKKNNEKLGLDETGTELDWIIANSKNQIFFYDASQSVKPSDVEKERFDELINGDDVHMVKLVSQLRSKGGKDLINFIDKLLWSKLETPNIFQSNDYELVLYENMNDLHSDLTVKENELGLSRLIAGYAWEWKSDPKRKGENRDLNAIDIVLDGMQFQWNKQNEDWVNSENSFEQVGSIHTIQGYDLNYAGIIFGWEIDYDPENEKIIVNKERYFDKYGRQGIENEETLEEYIVNIYKTIMYRAIHGTYVYVCNDNLRNYFKKHIKVFGDEEKSIEVISSPRIIPIEFVKPFVNAVPIYNLKISAGSFSDLQEVEEFDWVELPEHVSPKIDYFVCQVVGESMNKIIPNGSWCLFEKYSGGSRNGQIVLAEHYSFKNSEFGSGYTIKEYTSVKNIMDEEWRHESIVLKPNSYESTHQDIIIEDDALEGFNVIGIFKMII